MMAPQLHDGEHACVLIVEDEALISEMMADTLQEQGFDVLTVSNAADALRYLESGEQIDALFTDVDLPGGMNGSELASRVRSLRPEMPIVYASGGWRPSATQQMVCGSVFLAKPYDPYAAGNLLRQMMAHH